MVITIIFLVSLLSLSSNFTVHLSKRNLKVPLSKFYQYDVQMYRSNSQLIPSDIKIKHIVQNTLPFEGTTFDYFYYMDSDDLQCYQNAIGNNSFLYPCPFLTNGFSVIKTTKGVREDQFNHMPIGVLSSANFSYLVDNTAFPYPQGSYPWSALNISSSVEIDIEVKDSYKVISYRLIYINVTILLLYIVFIGKIIFDERRLNRKLNKNAAAASNHQVTMIQDDKQSQDSQQNDNYDIDIKTHKKKTEQNNQDINSIISSSKTSSNLERNMLRQPLTIS